MGRRQALGWLGAALCSVALVVAGGLALSSVAVNRYLQASTSAEQSGEATDVGPTPAAAELASVQRTVSAITTMPGVATASSSVGTDTTASATPTPTPEGPAVQPSPSAFSYDVSVVMSPDSTADQSADVVFMMTRQLQNARVNLELSSPAGDGHAASVIDYAHAFDTPVARSTVQSVSNAVAVAAAVPGVASIKVMVPYTWNLASGDLDVDFTTDDAHHAAALKNALSRTALSGVHWAPTSH